MMMNDDERAIELECQRAVITAEWTMAERKKRQKNEEFVYPNQKEAALKCVEAFQSGITQVCLVAQPGTGKTGASLEIMHLLTTHNNDDDCILKENLWILSGMNDKEWAKQYFKNMIKSFRDHIHHRGNLMKNKNEISQIQGGLLITDECHIASGKQMTVSKMLREAGLTDMDTIVARKMKMLDISATPEAVSFDLHSPGWRDKSRIIKLEPGPIYKGFQHMIDEDRILDAPEILTMEIALQILSMFQTRYERTTKKYFPFRIRGVAAKGFVHAAITRLGWTFIEHDSTSTGDDKNGPKYYDASGEEISKVDHMMLTAPEQHTIIFVKEFWRASKRLVRKHVGGSFVSKPKTQNTTAASQDLVARFCDNYNYDGDQIDPNYRPIHYTDKDAIEEYLNWFNHDCNYEVADYTSNRIKSSNGMVHAKPSKVHTSNMRNLNSGGPVKKQYNSLRAPIVIPLPSEQKQHIVEFLEGRTHNKNEKNEMIRSLVHDYFQHSTDAVQKEFMDIILTTEFFQCSTPGTEKSYEKNILKTVEAFQKNKTLKVKDKTTESGNNRNWQCFVDNKEYRLCFLWEVKIMNVPVVVSLTEEQIEQIMTTVESKGLLCQVVEEQLPNSVCIPVINEHNALCKYNPENAADKIQITNIIQAHQTNTPFEINTSEEQTWVWFVDVPSKKLYIVWR
jgi:hypothetical protein